MAGPAEADFEPLPPESEDFTPLPAGDQPLPGDLVRLADVFDPSEAPVLPPEEQRIGAMFTAAQLDRHDVDKRAAVLRLAKDTGASTDVIESNLDGLKSSWEVSKFDPKTWRAENPELAKLVLENQHLAPVVMRDPGLSTLSKVMNRAIDLFFTPYVGDQVPDREAELAKLEAYRDSLKTTPRGPVAYVDDAKAKYLRDNPSLSAKAVVPIARYLEAQQHLDISKLNFQLMTARALGADTYDIEKRLIDSKREAVQRDYNEGPVGQVASDVAEAAASSIDVAKKGGVGAIVAGTAAAAVAYGLTRSPASAGKYFLKGASIGGKVGGVAGTFQLETGDAYGDLDGAKTDDGQPLDKWVKTGAAVIYGGLASGIEFASWGPMFKAMGPLGELIKTGERKAALAALVRDAGFRDIAKRVGKNWVEASAAEGFEEFLQQVTQDSVEYLARSAQQGKLQTGPVVDLEKAFVAGEKGFVGGAGLATASVGVDIFTQQMLREHAQQSTQQVAALAKAADSATVKAAPDAVANVVTDITAKTGRPVTAVHVTATEFAAEAAKAGADPMAAADAMLGEGGAQALRDALQSGSKLEVPLATYLEKWVGTELGSRLVEHTTVAPQLATPAELKEQPAEQPAHPTPDASWFLAERLANTEQPVDRGAETYLDPISGLRNRRAFDETPAPAGKQLAVITSTDVKAINDHPTAGGHDVANGLLRAIGKAVGDHDATAARSGTNFLVYVKDQAELDSLLEKVRAAVGPYINLEHGLGADKASAFGALTTGVETGRALGSISPKGEASPGLDVAGLQFSDEKAQSTVPPELAAKVAGLSHEDYFAQAYTTKGGLLTAEAFRAIPRKAHTAAFDMSGLGAANATFGQEIGDKLLAKFEAALVAAGGADFDAAHLSGDEFAAQHDDPAELARFVARLRSAVDGVTLEARDRSTGEVQEVPVQFRHGVGADYAQADRALNAARRAEQAGGGNARTPGHQEARQGDLGSEAGTQPEPGRVRRQAYPPQVATAVDAEVARTAGAMGLRPIFRSAAEAGMSPEQYAEYLNGLEAAYSHASQSAALQAAKDQARTLEAWWKQQESAERTAAEVEYEQLQARRAQQFLKGRDPAAALAIPLDRAAVVAAVGEEAARRFQTRAHGGMNPDDLADMFGYATGEEMVKGIASLPAKEAWVKATAMDRMAEKHPDVLNDRLRLRDVISKGLHGAFTEKWLMEEWKALNARAHALVFNPEANRMQAVPNDLIGRPLPPAAETKKTAAAIVGRQKIGRLSPGWALRLERSHADNAAKAAARGNYARALVFKLQQLLAMHMWRELTEATAQREKFYDLAADLSKHAARARLGKGRPIYRDGVDLLLETFGLKQREDRAEPLPSLGEVTRAMEEDGATVGFDVAELNRLLAKPKSAKELTVAEMRLLDGALKNIRAAANGRATSLLEGKRVDREGLIAGLRAEAEKNRKAVGPVASSESAMTPLEAVKATANEFDGSLLRPETMIRWLGGGDLGSLWYRAVIEPLQKAKHRKADLLKAAALPVVQALEKALKNPRFMDKVKGRELFPTHRTDVEAPTRLYELWMMAVHMGNESNKSRLLEGRGITEQQVVDAIDKHLSKEMLDAVQAFWDANESLKKEAFALEERDSGLAPPAIEPTPLVTKHGTYPGGYAPARYDSRVEAVGERQESDAVAALFEPSYVRPGTAKSHLKSRVEGFTGVLSLEPSMIPRHLDQVVHDIAYREALKSVAGLVFNADLQRTMKERLGLGKAGQFKKWLQDVGTQNGADLADIWSRFGRSLKKRTVVAALAYRIPTALGDLSNYLIGAQRIGAAAMAAGMAEVVTNPDAFAFALSKSGELSSRNGQLNERFRADVALLTKVGGRARAAFDRFAQHGFTIYEWTEKLFAVPAWTGAYRSALKEGKTDADAVTYADAMVRRMLPAWNPVDQAGVQRSRYLAPFLTFFSWHSTVYSEVRDDFEPFFQATGVVDSTKKLAVATAATAWIIFSSYVVGELFSGRGPEPGDGDDDEERWIHWFARKMLSGAIQPLPFGGDVATAVESRVLHKHTNPRAGLFTAMIDPAVQAAEKMLDGDADGEAKFFAALRAVAPLLGVPQYPLTVPGRYALDVANGDQEPRNPADVVGGAVYGAREGQPANPASLIGDALSR